MTGASGAGLVSSGIEATAVPSAPQVRLFHAQVPPRPAVSRREAKSNMQSEPLSGGRPSAREIAAVLAELYGREFGGARTGKYRISRKFLRQVAGRRIGDRLTG